MRATDALVASGMVDETRMAAAGGSYGGYMVAWIEGHTDRFRCIVNHAGVYDTLAQYASDVTQGRHQSFGGEPWDGLEAIDRCNPGALRRRLQDADARDPRRAGLPRTGRRRGSSATACSRRRASPARLVYFPDENHWVLKPQELALLVSRSAGLAGALDDVAEAAKYPR